jgi:phage terminase large subunit
MQFIPEGMVDEAFERPTPPNDTGAPLLLGIDVAVGGGDKCVMRFRRGLDGRSIPPIKLAVDRDMGQDSLTVANKAAEVIERWEPDAVFIDEIGVGMGVADILKGMGYKLIRVNSGPPADDTVRFRDKRAEMWSGMKDWLREGGVLAEDLELRQDLCGPMYDHTLKQQLALERKRDMKRRGLASPDDADALALTFARKVKRLDRARSMNRRQRIAKGIDYDVFGVS